MADKTVVLNDEQYKVLIKAVAEDLGTKSYHLAKNIDTFISELKYDNDKKKNRAWAAAEINVIDTRIKEIKESIDHYYTLKENV